MSIVFNPFTATFDYTSSSTTWKDPVATFGDLPVSGNTAGDARIVLADHTAYHWDSVAVSWVFLNKITLATAGSTPNSSAASISASNQLTLQPANGSNPGIVSTTTQTFAGNKTFSGTVSASNLSGTNTGDVTLTAIGSSPNANSASLSGQALTLQPADGTNPGVLTSGTQTIGGNKTFSGSISASNFSGSSSGTNSGDITLTSFGSSPSANGASLSGQALTLQPADATRPGGVSVSSQTFAGSKTFSSGVISDTLDSSGTTLSIGTGTATTVNIGRSGSTINIIGDTIYETVTNLNVTDKNITINSGGSAGSATSSGIEIEEGGSITGYFRTSADRNSVAFKAPNTAGIVTLTPGASGFTLSQGSHDPLTLATVGSTPSTSGASLSSQVLTLQPADATNPGVVSTTTQSFAGNKTFTGSVTASNLSGTNSGDVTLTAVGSSPNANSASISGQALTIQPADATNPGVITSGTQSFGGNKTFTGTIAASNFSGSLTGTNTGDISLTTFGSTPSANGASLSGQALTLQPASATQPGGVSTTTQSFAGNKTFTGAVSASNLSGTNSGDVTLGSVGASPSANGASLSGQVLTLQPADATNPGVITTGTQTFAGSKTFSSTITADISGSSASFTGSLLGDVTGTQTATSIAATTVTGKLITGYVSGAGTVASTDTILQAINKLNGNGVLVAGAVTSVGTFGSSPNANAASISSNVLTLQPASGTQPGGVSTTTQTFAGDKTFSNNVFVTSPSTLQIGTTGGAITSNEQLSNLWTVADTAISASSQALGTAMTVTGNTGSSQAMRAIRAQLTRTITGTTTDSGSLRAAAAQVIFNNGANSYTMSAAGTNAQAAALNILAPTAGASAPTASYAGILLNNDTATINGYKNGIMLGTVTNGTNNAMLADNIAYSGNYAINLASTNASVLAGSLTASNISGTNTGNVTLASVGAVPAAAGASLSGQVLTLQPADATNPGVVTAGTQTFGGIKTFAAEADFNTFVRVGTTSPILNDELLTSSYTVTSAPAGTTTALSTKLNYNSNSASAQSLRGISLQVVRTITASVTDTGAVNGIVTNVILDIASGQTYTNSNGNAINSITVNTLNRNGSTGNITSNYQGINVLSDLGTLTGQKTALLFNTWSGGTNNAFIADNVTYTGDYAINLASTRSSVLSGNLFLSNPAKLMIGTTTGVFNTNEQLSNLWTVADTALTGTSAALTSKSVVTGNTGSTQNMRGIRTQIERSITGTTSEAGALYGITTGVLISNAANSYTNTGTASAAPAALNIGSILSGATAPVMNYNAIGINSDTTAITGRKQSIYLGTMSGGTHNAFITDNNAFTGDYAINLSSTRASVLGGALTVSGQFIGKGTATNDNAASTFIGEYIESVISVATSVGTTAVWSNLTSISLTAGDWELTGTFTINANGSTVATTAIPWAISVNSGATTTDHVDGSNQLYTSNPAGTTPRSGAIPGYRLSLSGTTTVYLKNQLTYTVATPTFTGRLSARRMR